MLENFRAQKIIWDRANKKIFEKIEANSGDSNGRKLIVQVINQEATENLSGTTLSLGWKSREGAKGLDAFNVVDASKGIFEIYYTTEMLSNIGNIEASLILIDSTNRIESSTFTINVRPSTVDDASVESENSFTALTEALVKVSALEDNYAPRLNEVTEKLAQTVEKTTDKKTVHWDIVNGDDNSIFGPYKTWNKVWSAIPSGTTKEIIIQLAEGVYDLNGGSDEWGRPVLLNFYEKFINPKRDDDIPVDTKGGKVKIKGAGKEKTILDGGNINARVGIYGHNIKNLFIEDLKIIGCNTALLAHEGGDISVLRVDISGNGFGIAMESHARLEIGWSEIHDNGTNVYLKNGQLQMNNTKVDNATDFNWRIEGAPYIITDEVTSKTLPGKTCIDARGAGFWDMRMCDFGGSENSVFLIGTIQHLQISQGTHIHEFGSNAFATRGGFIHCIGTQIWGNGFVAFITEGNPYIKMDNVGIKNKDNVEVPNTQTTPIRMNGTGTFHPTGSTVGLFRELYNPPLSSPVLFGTAPPTSGFHFKGKVMFNTEASSGQPMGWQCTVAGDPGTWSALPLIP